MTSYFASPSMRFLRDRFTSLYGEEAAPRCLDRLAMMIGRYGVGGVNRGGREKWTQQDVVLITYADMIRDPVRPPLATLKTFIDQHLREAFSAIHILPFFPSSSDDGFAVIHYRQVSSELGGWEDVQAIGEHFQLMFDLVLNHVSSQSNWFADYQTGTAPGRHYFIEDSPSTDLSAVVRPRTHPLLTPVNTRDGQHYVWTTFSEDQVDLNYANPDVLFEMLDLLLFYVSMGGRIFRLDAVAYLWKTIGTNCIHLPQTYEVVRLFREFLKVVVPDALLLTETNVPHEENVSYFGKGDAAHMVYQFPLPPLILDALVNDNAQWLTKWTRDLHPPPAGCTFLNFTASHDGIGVRPLQGLVPDEHLAGLVEHIRQRGGAVSMKRNSDGSESPYELNCTWFDAMGRAKEASYLHEARFLCSQTIPLMLQGIPAVYFHSMTATPNNMDEVQRTGMARSVNRGRWERADLEARLAESTSATARVFFEMQRRLLVRRKYAAFHPNAEQKVLALDDRVFAVVRRPQGGAPAVLAVANMTSALLTLPTASFKDIELGSGGVEDVLVPGHFWDPCDPLILEPYQCAWFVGKIS